MNIQDFKETKKIVDNDIYEGHELSENEVAIQYDGCYYIIEDKENKEYSLTLGNEEIVDTNLELLELKLLAYVNEFA